MPKSKTYRNKIDALLGITVGDIDDICKVSHLHKQRERQRRRWSAHLRRKA